MVRTIVGLCLGVVGFAVLAADKPKKDGPLVEARTRLNRGNYAEARAGYEKLLADAKTATAAAIGLANAWRQEGEYDKAAAVLEDALKRTPADVDLLAARADLKYTLGQWDAATADTDNVLKSAPDHFSARWVQARLSRDKGDMPTADQQVRWFVRTYTAASNADKDITDPDHLLIVGQAGAENARWNNLPNQFRFILKEIYGTDILKTNEPDCWRAEYLIGRMLLEKFNRPQALEAFDNALKINPNAAEAYVGKGLAALQRFDLKEADQFADQALKHNPKLPEARQIKADVAFASGDYAAAEKQLLQAKAVNPRDETTLGKLAACYVVQKKTAQFDELTATVAGFDAKPSDYFLALAEYLEDRKWYDRAEVYFRKAAELRPKNAGPRTSLGMLHMRLGKEDEGRKLLDEAFKVDPFNVRVANMRKVIEHLTGYKSIETPHYTLKFDPRTDAVLAAFVADYLEEVHAELKAQFGYEPPGRIPVEVFSRHDMFSGRTVGLPDLHTIGACTGRVVVMASPTANGVSKPFNWGRVLRHELTHVFNLTQTDYQCPHWLTEGLAVRNEKMERPLPWVAALRNRSEARTLFNLDTVMMGFVRPQGPEDWTLAYCQSQLYVEHLVNTKGEGAIGKLLSAYQGGADTTAALATIGIDKTEFEKSYLNYVEQVLKPYRKAQKAEAMPAEAPRPMLTFEELQAAFKENPDDLETAARLADQLLRRGKSNEARKMVDDVLRKKPGHPIASLTKARLLSRGGDDEGGREVLEEALKANPDDPRLLGMVGRYMLEAEQFDRAAEVFERGRKTVPLEGDWLEQLIKTYTAAKQTDKLIGVLREMVARNPDELDGRLQLARTASEAKKWVEAEEFAREGLMIDVTNAEARELYLAALKAQGKTDFAEKVAGRYTSKQ